MIQRLVSDERLPLCAGPTSADVLVTNTKTKLCFLFLDGSPAHSLSSISTQYSSEDGSHAATMKEDIKCKANTAGVHCGNENGEKKLPGMEENQETSALEKNGIDEAERAKPEDLTAREDTGIFHESILKIQHHSPEDKGEVKQAVPVEITVGEDEEVNASTRREDGEEVLPVPLESSMMEAEDDNEEPPLDTEGGGECSPSAQLSARLPSHRVTVQPRECRCGTGVKLLEYSVLCELHCHQNATSVCSFFSSASSARLWLLFFTPVAGFHIPCNDYNIQI